MATKEDKKTKEVRVKDEEVVLAYTMPIAEKGTTNKEVAVLSSVQYGGLRCSIGGTYAVDFTLY